MINIIFYHFFSKNYKNGLDKTRLSNKYSWKVITIVNSNL